MPSDVQWKVLFVLLLVFIIIRLGHREAMRYSKSARLIFDRPEVHAPWSLTGQTTEIMSSVTINVRNVPYKTDGGNDVEAAWVRIELFDITSRPIQAWDFARWEENKHPPYTGTPFYQHEENFRTLRANRSPNRITVATKRLLEEKADRLRGIDQTTNWMDQNNRIPPGEYFVRLTIEGGGLQESAQHVFMLRNPGKDRSLETYEATQPLQRYWPTS
jgi:hypothetical protein